jgi:hypothetical protein
MRLKDILPVDVIETNIDPDPMMVRYTEQHGRTTQTGTGI